MSYLVYKHTTPNGKVYIGITSKTTKERWRNNGTGYHHNNHWQSAIKKYGWENINHEILLENLTKEEAEKKEIELISLYKSNQREYGYNIASGGSVNKGFSRSEEVRKKISKSLKERYKIVKPQRRKLTEDEKQHLKEINLGKKLTEETKRKISEANKGKSKSKEFKEKVRQREQSKVNNIIQIDFNGKIINIFNSIQEASRKTNASATKICQVCKGKRNHTKNYIWLYEKDKNLIKERINKLKGCA